MEDDAPNEMKSPPQLQPQPQPQPQPSPSEVEPSQSQADLEADLLKIVMEAEGADMGSFADQLRQQQMQLEMYQRKTRTGVRRTSSSTGKK